MSAPRDHVTLPPNPDDREAVDLFHAFCERYHINWESERGFVAVEIGGEMQALYPTGVLIINTGGEPEIVYEGDPTLAV